MYQRIMDDVIESCQVTFEEDGVNQHTLDDLRKVGASAVFVLLSYLYCVAFTTDDVHSLRSIVCDMVFFLP